MAAGFSLFDSPNAAPRNRAHAEAARVILEQLVPESGTDIKGSCRLASALLNASEYRNRPERFTDLLGLLDGDLRLITPTVSPATGDAERRFLPSLWDTLRIRCLVPTQ